MPTSDQRHDQPEPQGPGEGGVGHALEQQQHRCEQVHRPDQRYGGGHRVPHGGVERRAHVVVAGGAERRSTCDKGHLDEERDHRDPRNEGDEAPTAPHEGQHPEQREAVDGDGDGELHRLEPGRRAGYDAWVEQEPGQGYRQDHQHRRADESERPARRPGAYQ